MNRVRLFNWAEFCFHAYCYVQHAMKRYDPANNPQKYPSFILLAFLGIKILVVSEMSAIIPQGHPNRNTSSPWDWKCAPSFGSFF